VVSRTEAAECQYRSGAEKGPEKGEGETIPLRGEGLARDEKKRREEKEISSAPEKLRWGGRV